ncbi:unnamed protein product, partial [Chrysoparadoxa australica]
LGIDTETKPNFKKGDARNPTSLLQVAARDAQGGEQVYLFDLLSLLGRQRAYTHFDSCLKDAFWSSKKVKLGQGLKQDLQELHRSYPQCLAFKRLRGVIETNSLHRQLNPQDKQVVGLKRLTQRYIHCALDKRQQCSNWSRRPLTEGQQTYAATDALVLLRLHDAMTHEVPHNL